MSSNKIPYVQVLNIPLFNGNIEGFFEIMKEDFGSGKKLNRQISFCDANVLVSTISNPQLKETLIKKTFINMPDGMPGVWIGRIKGAKHIDRCYGPDVFEHVVKNTANKSYVKHYFSGGNIGVAEKLKKYCESKLGNKNIVGIHCPPFREMEEYEIQGIADEINSKNVDLVWIGISSPKQDIYARRLCKYLNVHYIFTVGAAFDFFTGGVKQAPKFIQKSGLEWLFRLMMEPKRLWKRYFKIIPLFIYYNIVDVFRLLNR